MMKKFKIIFIILFVTVLNTRCQNPKSLDISKAIIKIDSCGLYYKGQRLDVGTPLSEWEKVLGKPTRVFEAVLDSLHSGTNTWDDKGISVNNFESGDGTVAELRIHFLNLDSPEGKSGQLNYARDWEERDEEWKKNMLNDKNGSPEENKKMVEEIEEENAPKNFIYPFTTYKGYVNLHGFPIGAGMKVNEINSYRKELSFSGPFGYVDDAIDGVNDSGNTTDTFGGDYRAGGTACKDMRLQYYELTYTASGALEFLKIGYEDKSNFEYRKERDERHIKELEEALKENKK